MVLVVEGHNKEEKKEEENPPQNKRTNTNERQKRVEHLRLEKGL